MMRECLWLKYQIIDNEENIYNKRDIRLAKLSAILQMANALDRSYKQKIKKFHIEIG